MKVSSAALGLFPFLFAATLSAQQSTLTYYEHIKPITDAYCSGCHSPGNIGPFPLTTYKEVYGKRYWVAGAGESGKMPPWHADPVRPYLYDISLSSAQKSLIAQWVEQGAAEGDPAQEGKPITLERAEITQTDAEVGMSEPYTLKEGSGDIYRCFVLDWVAETDEYLSGYKVEPGNLKMLHHAAVFMVSPDKLSKVREMEAEDSEPGYQCFGGPYTSGKVVQMPFVGISSPGNNNFVFPRGSGISIPKGTKLVMQVHYSLHGSGAGSQNDQTKMRLQFSKEKVQAGYFLPITNPLWPLFPKTMSIPVGAKGHEVSVEGNPFSRWYILKYLFAKSLDSSKGIRIHAVSPHMHQRGRTLKLTIVRSGGETETVFSTSDWDFHWQGAFFFQQAVVWRAGDRIRLSCTFDNLADSVAHHGDEGHQQAPLKDVTWGESTTDEMCVSTIYITENGEAVR